MILRVQLLYSVHGLRQRVRGEQLQLHGLVALGLGLVGFRLVGLLLARRAAEQRERAHHGERARSRHRNAEVLLHKIPFPGSLASTHAVPPAPAP